MSKKNFKVWERKKMVELENLSLKKALRLEESLLSSSLIWQWRKNFFKDSPICLKDGLKKKA